MLTTQTAIELVREKLGNCTDYRLSKIYGVSPSTIANWRDGKTVFDEKNAFLSANLAEIDPHYLLSSIQAERAQKAGNPDVANVWLDVLSMISKQTGQPGFMAQAKLAF